MLWSSYICFEFIYSEKFQMCMQFVQNTNKRLMSDDLRRFEKNAKCFRLEIFFSSCCISHLLIRVSKDSFYSSLRWLIVDCRKGGGLKEACALPRKGFIALSYVDLQYSLKHYSSAVISFIKFSFQSPLRRMTLAARRFINERCFVQYSIVYPIDGLHAKIG